ncbi:restriction endonuclease subunit S [Armatimonas sp.]|uniref:restriction endonuclease subunit S n=1 Tax=Armatimonas sp. TaxID=1872638 RepID=UPI003750FDB2
MASEWKTERLVALCELIADCPHSTPLWTDSGVIVLRNPNIRGGRLDLSTVSFTDEDHYEQRSRRARLKAGDLVLTREAPMGEVCMIPEGLRCCLGQRMVMLRTDPKKCDSRFLLYSIQSNAVQHEIKVNEGTGSTVSNLRIPLLEALPIFHPPLAEQKRIAHILGTLDDKIELNRRMNATLEAIAQALFKSWFVDFDPVRAKASGEAEESICQRLGLTSEVLALFPDRLVESELGEIPTGWEVAPLGNLIELAYGKTLKAEDRQGGEVPVFGSNGIIGWHHKKLVSGPGIIVGRKGNPGIVTWSHADFFPIDTTFYVVCLTHIKSLYFFYYALNLQNLGNLGADSAVPGLNRNHAYMSRQVIPNIKIFKFFDAQIASIFAQKYSNDQQNRTLANLRDTLLPKLLSGELSVAEAGEVVEGNG